MKKNVSIIGLDIGSYSIKHVQILKQNEQIALENAAITLFSTRSSGGITGILKNLFPDAASSDKKFRISVSGPSLIIRRIKLPTMTSQELKGAIRFQAEAHLPFPVDNCRVDCQILAQNPQDKSMDVLLVAVKRDFLERRLKELESAGICPALVDTDVFCVTNAFEHLGQNQDKTYGLLNIGHQVSSFAIMHENTLHFVREIPQGGFELTQALASIRQINEKEAGKLKMDRSPAILNDLRLATQKGLESLATELGHSIDYFENEAGADLKFIWASGGGALSYGATEVLSEMTGRKVSLWDNMQKIQVAPAVDGIFIKEHSPELNVALGLALRK